MKTKKRDGRTHAHHLGMRAGVRGRTTAVCPFTTLSEKRMAWIAGWREGHAYKRDGCILLQYVD